MSTAGHALAFDRAVELLCAQGVPREKAEARMREEMPEVARVLDTAEVKREAVLESAEQRHIVKMWLALGGKAYSTSQYRPGKVTPGPTDLELTHKARSFFGKWETKRQVVPGVVSPSDAERSTAQVEYGDEMQAAGIPYGYGDRFAFADWLRAHGFAVDAGML